MPILTLYFVFNLYTHWSFSNKCRCDFISFLFMPLKAVTLKNIKNCLSLYVVRLLTPRERTCRIHQQMAPWAILLQYRHWQKVEVSSNPCVHMTMSTAGRNLENIRKITVNFWQNVQSILSPYFSKKSAFIIFISMEKFS